MKKTTAILKYIISIHIFALIILLILRIAMFISNAKLSTDSLDKKDNLNNFFIAIVNGFKFDNVVICMVMSLPLLVLTIMSLFNIISKTLIKFFSLYIILVFSLIFFNSAADIPYYSYFFSHVSDTAVSIFLDSSGNARTMIFQEYRYYIYILLYIVLIICFSIAVIKTSKKLINKETVNIYKRDYKFYIPAIFVFFSLYFIGIRGSLSNRPIHTYMAYFCDNSFYNMLGINPTFFLVKSIEKNNGKYNLNNQFSVEKSIKYVKNFINTQDKSSDINDLSLTRFVIPNGNPINANIVFILMESFSSEFLEWENNEKSLTPYLHSLIENSYYFENFYSAGIHTNNGILATIYGFLPQFDKLCLNTGQYFFGIPMNLKEYGYRNLFFITGNPNYDNMYVFLKDNGFDKIYSQNDYPTDKRVNFWGVPDDYIFKFGINELNKMHEENKPFFATFLTVSNHPPFVIPKKYKNVGNNEMESIISYVDDSIKEFMEDAKKQDWYKNTIFVLLGDHGKIIGEQTYDMPLSYNHIPLIIYSDIFDKPKKLKNFGGQVDVYPTIMGLLNRPYINNSLGVDLFKTKRPYMFFVSDEYLGCIDDKFFYTYEASSGKETLYDYRSKSTKDLKYQYSNTTDSMKTYSTSMFLISKHITNYKLSRPNNIAINNFFKK